MNKKIITFIVCILFAIALFIGISNTSEDEEVVTDNLTVTDTQEESTTQSIFDSIFGSEETEKESATEKNTALNNSQSVNSGIKDVSPNNIPAYNGKAYVVINDNNPEFTASEKKMKKSFEKYSPLDSYGRCSIAFSLIGKDIMPTGKRGEIGQIKPSGWQTVKYDFVDGKYLYNRCHLIGWQLTGENANERNLITGTRYMNVEGMLPFENMVDDYIEETNNHVLYKVTPIFKGNELVARGVQIEAYSVEDEGDGICFNVYCFNVQPGVQIDYLTGLSAPEGKEITSQATTKKPTTTTQKITTTQTTTTTKLNSNTTYILNINSNKFHKPNCASAKKISTENRRETSESRDVLISRGYKPCGNCNP